MVVYIIYDYKDDENKTFFFHLKTNKANDANQDKTGHRGRSNSSNETSKAHQAEISKLNFINTKDCSTEILLDDSNLPIVIVTRDQPD